MSVLHSSHVKGTLRTLQVTRTSLVKDQGARQDLQQVVTSVVSRDSVCIASSNVAFDDPDIWPVTSRMRVCELIVERKQMQWLERSLVLKLEVS